MAASTAEKISRVPRSKDEARSIYDRLSSWYDLLAGSETRFTAIGLQLLDLRAGEKVLEIGFGTGRNLLRIATAVGTVGKVCGLDLSAGMRNVAARRLERASLDGRAELRLGDAAELPYDSAGFDAVFMGFTLELFDTPEIPVVLNECRRVLRTGGRLAVVAMAKGRPGLLVPVYEWAHARYPQYFDCRPIFAQPALENARFHVVRAEKHKMWGLPVDVLLAVKSGE